jgi:hypothetical protein
MAPAQQFQLNSKIGDNCLLYLGEDHIRGIKRRYAKFQCSCGHQFFAILANVKCNHTKSCGRKECSEISKGKVTHGGVLKGKKTKEFSSWANMKARCLNPNNKNYEHYGQRGIGICDTWVNSFPDFLADMGHMPENCSSLDRIDNDLGYSKENCRWANQSTQLSNQRRSRRITYLGIEMSLREAIDLNGEYDRSYYDLARDYLEIKTFEELKKKREEIDERKAMKGRAICIDGAWCSVQRACSIYGVDVSSVLKRLQAGQDLKEALDTVYKNKRHRH